MKCNNALRLNIAYGCFNAFKAELSGCNRDCITVYHAKPKIFLLWPCIEKSLPVSDVEDFIHITTVTRVTTLESDRRDCDMNGGA